MLSTVFVELPSFLPILRLVVQKSVGLTSALPNSILSVGWCI